MRIAGFEPARLSALPPQGNEAAITPYAQSNFGCWGETRTHVVSKCGGFTGRGLRYSATPNMVVPRGFEPLH